MNHGVRAILISLDIRELASVLDHEPLLLLVDMCLLEYMESSDRPCAKEKKGSDCIHVTAYPVRVIHLLYRPTVWAPLGLPLFSSSSSSSALCAPKKRHRRGAVILDLDRACI